MNHAQNKKGDGKSKPVFRSDAPLIFKANGYTCVRDDYFDKILHALRSEISAAVRKKNILAEIEK